VLAGRHVARNSDGGAGVGVGKCDHGDMKHLFQARWFKHFGRRTIKDDGAIPHRDNAMCEP